MSTIDSTGADLDDFATTRAKIIAEFRAAFGDNFDDDDQSISGVLSGILADIISDQNDLIREAINARNPQAAQGLHLSNIALFNGAIRRAPEYATVVLSCTALSTGSTIVAGSLVQDPDNADLEFATDVDLILGPDETGTVSATATAAGVGSALAGTLTKIVNPVYGWFAVTNAAASVPGRTVESDLDLRARRKQISRQTGLQSLPKLYLALSNIDEIGRVVVRENKTGYVNSLGQIPHSVWVVAQGGSDEEIAYAIYHNTSGGIDWHGSESITYSDPITGEDYTIRFDRVVEAPIQIRIVLDKKPTYPADGDALIKAAIVDYASGSFIQSDGETNNGFDIGENVEYFRLTTPINSIGGHSIKTLQIARVGETLAAEDVDITPLELATFDIVDIDIDTY
jgi:uncharacterized phage protein gp47/JayE